MIEVAADPPAATVQLADLPVDAAAAVGKASINDRSPRGRITGSEGKKIGLRPYARQVDRALRARLAGRDVPLVLAAVQSLGAIFRSVNTYPHLATAGIEGNPERLADWRERFVQRRNQGRASTAVAQVARAATFEAVQSLLVAMDRVMDGRLDETDGRIEEASAAAADSYRIRDEIARRVLLSGGEVMAARSWR